MVMRKDRFAGSDARNRSSNRPAGAVQSISPVHQFSVEGMFTRANAQKIERLLYEPIADFGVLAQAPGQSLIARTHPASLFANQQTSRQP